MATLRNHAAHIGLGLAGLFLGVHPAMAQPTDPNSAGTLANRLGQAIDGLVPPAVAESLQNDNPYT